MKYNYIFYGVTNDFYRHSFADFAKIGNALALGDFFESNYKLLNILFKIHTYPQTNKYFDLPFKTIWNKNCFKFDFKNDRPICFIFEAKYFGQWSFFQYMREKYPECKLVISFRDLVHKYLMSYPRMKLGQMRKDFDLLMSYNKYDCEEYGMNYFNTEASKENIVVDNNYPWHDVVFIGAIKDRKEIIEKAYDILTNAGINCFFYVYCHDKLPPKHGNIIYTKQRMPYSDMLKHSVNSLCILELSQKHEYGFTSRAQEAFMYNKRLITDSLIVKEQPFYSDKNVQFISDVSEINPDFIKNPEKVDYGYTGEYSPIKMIETVEKLLTCQER